MEEELKNIPTSLDKAQYVNREISWLRFNERVLQEAADPSVPLLIRMKFLGIFSSNLDEFFRVRVAVLKRATNVNKQVKNTLGFSPKKILKQIHKKVVKQQKRFEKIFADIQKGLSQYHIYLINEKNLTPERGKLVKNYFHDKVRPLLVPLMLSNINKFPSLMDGSIYLAVYLDKVDSEAPPQYALIEMPTDKISRFLVLDKSNGKTFIMLLDDVVRYCLDDIFAIFGYDACCAFTIKITKDAETDLDNDVSKSFLELIKISINKRKYGQHVRFIHDEEMIPELRDFLIEKLKITDEDNIIPGGRYHNFKDFMVFPTVGPPQLSSKKLLPLPHPLIDPTKSIIQLIKQKDIMLHVPYQSYHPMIDFLREAAIDPAVVSIKISLYRVAKQSNIINALINACKNGKKVVAVVELQARFDEEANIEWAKVLQDAGIKVMHGPANMKIHAKLCLISKKETVLVKHEKEEKEELKTVNYAAVSTGNFNEDTAKVYSDFTLFTSHKGIIKDIKKVFSHIEKRGNSPEYNHLLVSPHYLYQQLCQFIDIEIAHAKAGKPAAIIAKLNSLNDEGMINKLYEASKAGVKIQLIVRGICSLIPGIPELSENITAISIVDKYLEHARVYVFENGGEKRYYIASADWMERNLHRRIEIACPIYDKSLQQELDTFLQFQLNDNVKARCLNHPDGIDIRQTNEQQAFRMQNELYYYFQQQTTHFRY